MRLNKISILAFAAILPFTAIANSNPESGLDVETQQTASNNEAETDAPLDYTKKQAIVVAKRSTILRGQEYKADIVMLNRDANCTYKTYVNDKLIENGKFSFIGSAVGKMTYRGYILETDKKGNSKQYPFKFECQVTEPFALISNSNTGVFYAGTSNYIEIIAPGISMSDMSIIVSNAKLVRTPKSFDVRPVRSDIDCEVLVSAKIDDMNVTLARKTFHTIPLPTPKAFLSDSENTYADGIIAKDMLVAAKTIVANYEEISIYAKEPRYSILGFDIKCYGKKGKAISFHSDSDEITDNMRAALNKLKKGDTVYVTNIVAKGSDGKTRNLSPIEIVVK